MSQEVAYITTPKARLYDLLATGLREATSPACEHSVIEKFWRIGGEIKAHHEAWKESNIIPGWVVDEFTQQVKNDTLRVYDLLKDKINISDNPYYENIDEQKYFTNLYQNRATFVEGVERVNRKRIDDIKEFIGMFRQTVMKDKSKSKKAPSQND